MANPNSGGFTSFQNRDGGELALEAGTQVVRVTFNGGSQDARSITLTRVEEVANSAPVARAIADQTAEEDAAFAFDASTAFSDPDGIA